MAFVQGRYEDQMVVAGMATLRHYLVVNSMLFNNEADSQNTEISSDGERKGSVHVVGRGQVAVNVVHIEMCETLW